MARAKKKTSTRIGRPPLASEEIRLIVRLDRETDEALTKLAKKWKMTRSEALRKAVKERAKRMSLV